jgi:colanic acid biosynthesis glycosyl transferase WcaI
MHILIHGLNFSPELVGVGKYTGELAQSLVKKGHKVTVVTAPPYYPQWKIRPGFSGNKYQTEILGNLKVIRCPVWVPMQVSGLKRIFHLLSFSLSSAPVVLREARYKPDIIFSIAPALLATPASSGAGKRWKIPTWLHIQDFEIDAALDLGIVNNRSLVRSLVSSFEKGVYRKFDRVSTISNKMVERLVEKGVPREKTVFFPNWVDTTEIFPLEKSNSFRQILGFNNKEVVVLYSGSMGAKQGLEVIIECARLLQKDRNIHFVICGEGPAKSQLKQTASGLSNVHFLSIQPAEKFNELLNMADIHILPQKSGAADLVMPSKLLGALASSKPVIAGCSEGSELHQVVSQVGVTVVPEDPSSLAASILALATNSVRRTKLGKSGREFVIQHYSKAAIIDRFISEMDSFVRKIGN